MSGKRLWNSVKRPDKSGWLNLLWDRVNRSDRYAILVWLIGHFQYTLRILVSLAHWLDILVSLDHHVASLFLLSLFIFVNAWVSQYDLDLSNFTLSRWQWIFSSYTIKTPLLVHVILISWFNKYQHLELSDSSWLDWYIGVKHPLALFHHIRYLNGKTLTFSSPMYGSSWPNSCWSFFNLYHDLHASSCLR
jgi:hypothetical protein